MALKVPLRFQYSGTDTVGLSEYQATDQIAWSYIYAVSGVDIKTINGIYFGHQVEIKGLIF